MAMKNQAKVKQMNPLKIKDNQLKLKTDFADVEAITDVIADKTFEQLEKDGIFVFPEIIKDADDISMYVEQIYDLARITNAPLSVDDMSKFIKRSNDIMLKNMHK